MTRGHPLMVSTLFYVTRRGFNPSLGLMPTSLKSDLAPHRLWMVFGTGLGGFLALGNLGNLGEGVPGGTYGLWIGLVSLGRGAQLRRFFFFLPIGRSRFPKLLSFDAYEYSIMY